MKINKIGILLMTCLSVGALGVCNACTPAQVVATSVALNKSETVILLGSSETLTVTFTPDNTSNKEVVWSSSDETVASVADGVVTANKVGKAIITVASVANNQLSASCEVTVTDNVRLSGVAEKHEFTLFNDNKNRSETNDNGFYDHDQSYKVGDDNAFNVKPTLSVVDAETYQPVSASDWDYDFTISATLNGQPAGSQYFSVVDARECDVQFTAEAVGKTFTISVAPGGVDATRVASLTKSITVDVVDGYNVYNAKELGYFDTRFPDDTIDETYMESDQVWKCKWVEFKQNNHLRTNYTPASLIFQTDIVVTPNDIPANFIYSQADAQAIGDNRAANSMRDWMYIYERTIAGDMTVDGNYFALDFSALPLIKRESFAPTEIGAVVGHSAIFKTIRGGDVEFRNINMTGNAKKATGDDDKIYGGGIMFAKGAGSETFKAYNMIATKFFITFMGQTPNLPDCPFTEFSLEKVKCFNNYNSFMYNWGSTLTAKDSLFRGCGGPIIIQDHVDTDEYEQFNGMAIVGHAPTTNFIDCTLKNLVTGSEAWFQQFGAQSKTPDIKAMSDLFYGSGISKSFVVNEQQQGMLYQALAAQGQNSYFNFIVLNKSGKAQGMTEYPACGTVNIVESNKTLTFDYCQPDKDPVGQANIAYQTALVIGTEQEQQAALQTLVATAIQNGVAINPQTDTPQQINDKITEYLTGVCTPHGMLRGLNSNGAPVFDFGAGFDLLSIDSNLLEHPWLQPAAAVVAGTPTRFTPSTTQAANLPNYVTLYYNGMALVMGLSDYVS